MTLGQRIYALRSEKHLSQGELADLLDISRQSVSKWENDTAVPDLDKLIRLCDIFELSLDELTGRTSRASTPTAGPSPKPDVLQRTSFAARNVIGFILLTLTFLLTLVFIILRAEPHPFIVFVQPLLLCGLICLLSKRHVGYRCIWAVYLSVEFAVTFFYGLSLLKGTLFLRFVFIAFMFFISWFMFRQSKIPVSKKRGYVMIIGWLVYLAAAWFIPRFFYIFPTRLWFDRPDMSRMLFYYLTNSLATVGLAFLLRHTVCCLRSRTRK